MSIAARVLGPPSFDEVAVVRRALGPRDGCMLDVGAHTGSTALPFARTGWDVHAFEPDPDNRARLLDRVGHMDNVAVVAAAVADRAGTQTLYRSDVSTGISALAPFHPSHRRSGEVEVTTLTEYLDKAEIREVDLLKVDTEGHDLFVLQGVPWDRIEPAAVVCEFEDRKTVPLGYTFEDLAGYLDERGYAVLVSEWHPIVEYGQRHTWRRIVRWPNALADGNAWGNLIAVKPRLEPAVTRSARAAALRLQVRRAVEGLVRRS